VHTININASIKCIGVNLTKSDILLKKVGHWVSEEHLILVCNIVSKKGIWSKEGSVDTYAILHGIIMNVCLFTGEKVMCFHSNTMPTVKRHW